MESKLIRNLDTLTQRDKIQFCISGALMFVGVIMLFVGLLIEPSGVIHNSVLIALVRLQHWQQRYLELMPFIQMHYKKLCRVSEQRTRQMNKANKNSSPFFCIFYYFCYIYL